MYGMINRSFEEMVVRLWGEERWQQIRQRAGLEVEVFISNEGYPDEVTYRLVRAASEVLGQSEPELLERFGVHWVAHTPCGYGDIMRSNGRNLREFLLNLPNLHARVRLFLPRLAPPRFECDEVGEGALRLRYFSSRAGLVPFVVGLLRGLGEMFNTPLRVTRVPSEQARGHEEFLLEWGEAAGP